MAQRLSAAARDAAVKRVNFITTGAVVLGLAGTVGLGMSIASMIPVKPAGYSQPAAAEVPAEVPGSEQAPAPGQAPAQAPAAKPKTKAQGGAVTPKPQAAPKPQPTKKAPVTTSGGS
jgi:hypothetical protein